jgi:hypothetical protein
MKIASIDYTTFWSLVSSKSLLPQYIDGGDCYSIFAVEDNISWETIAQKDGTANQTDFETNHLASCNQPLEYRSIDGLPKVASAMFTDNLSYWVDGSNGILSIPAGQTGYVKTNFSFPFKLQGIDFHWDGSNFGDYLNFEAGVYNNNDTSSEANFIQLSQYANKYRVIGSDTKSFIVDTVKTVPPTYNGLNIYLRTTYVNVGSASVNLCVNLIGYK